MGWSDETCQAWTVCSLTEHVLDTNMNFSSSELELVMHRKEIHE
jgi:hypothetical protein